HAFGDPQIRINPNREFFKIEPERIIPLLEYLKIKDTTEVTNQIISESINEEDKKANVNYRTRRPNFNFREMGINPKEKIIFDDENESIEAIVINEKRVEYENEEYTLSKLTAKLLGNVSYGVTPLSKWKYNGIYLSDYYDEIHG
ncbi:MAG: hypothetical protein LBB56_00220, partial [Chitinispirillales bacterium]|nr:hypothetical protein [Chitinispirillales bacterium]